MMEARKPSLRLPAEIDDKRETTTWEVFADYKGGGHFHCKVIGFRARVALVRKLTRSGAEIQYRRV